MAFYTLQHKGSEIDAAINQVKDGIPGVAPRIISYGVNSFEDISRDNSLPIEAFSRIPAEGEIFFFVAKTSNGDVVGITARSNGILPNNEYVGFSVMGKILFDSPTALDSISNTVQASSEAIARVSDELADIKTEEWSFDIENEDGTTSTVTKKVCVQR